MVEILIGIAGFLGGSFLTAVVFIVGYTGRLTTVEQSVKNIEKKLDTWETKGMPTCALHLTFEERLRAVEIKDGGK